MSTLLTRAESWSLHCGVRRCCSALTAPRTGRGSWASVRRAVLKPLGLADTDGTEGSACPARSVLNIGTPASSREQPQAANPSHECVCTSRGDGSHLARPHRSAAPARRKSAQRGRRCPIAQPDGRAARTARAAALASQRRRPLRSSARVACPLGRASWRALSLASWGLADAAAVAWP